MSEKYRETMDRLVVSEELKTRISNAAAEKLSEKTTKSKNSGIFYLRYSAGLAACMIFCLLAVSVTKDEPQNVVTPNVEITDNFGEKTPEKIIDEQPENADETKNENRAPGRAKSVSPVAEKPQRQENQYPSPNEENTQGTMPEQTAPDLAAPPMAEPPVENAGKEPDPAPGGVMGGIENFDAQSLTELREEAGYDFKAPGYIPQGYAFESANLLFGTMIQIKYTADGDKSIIYRTEKTDGDISGDYNVYDDITTEQINGETVTIRSRGEKSYSAFWNDTDAYALYCCEGINKDEMWKIIEGATYVVTAEQ